MRDGERERRGGRTKRGVMEREGEGRLGKMSVGKGERREGEVRRNERGKYILDRDGEVRVGRGG